MSATPTGLEPAASAVTGRSKAGWLLAAGAERSQNSRSEAYLATAATCRRWRLMELRRDTDGTRAARTSSADGRRMTWSPLGAAVQSLMKGTSVNGNRWLEMEMDLTCRYVVGRIEPGRPSCGPVADFSDRQLTHQVRLAQPPKYRGTLARSVDVVGWGWQSCSDANLSTCIGIRWRRTVVLRPIGLTYGSPGTCRAPRRPL